MIIGAGPRNPTAEAQTQLERIGSAVDGSAAGLAPSVQPADESRKVLGEVSFLSLLAFLDEHAPDRVTRQPSVWRAWTNRAGRSVPP